MNLVVDSDVLLKNIFVDILNSHKKIVDCYNSHFHLEFIATMAIGQDSKWNLYSNHNIENKSKKKKKKNTRRTPLEIFQSACQCLNMDNVLYNFIDDYGKCGLNSDQIYKSITDMHQIKPYAFVPSLEDINRLYFPKSVNVIKTIFNGNQIEKIIDIIPETTGIYINMNTGNITVVNKDTKVVCDENEYFYSWKQLISFQYNTL